MIAVVFVRKFVGTRARAMAALIKKLATVAAICNVSHLKLCSLHAVLYRVNDIMALFSGRSS